MADCEGYSFTHSSGSSMCEGYHFQFGLVRTKSGSLFMEAKALTEAEQAVNNDVASFSYMQIFSIV